ncbi:purine-cytosine permease family protein [Peribacillus butanolivorans]|uniref:purine-cytosine permease family protein n=1 Tax=Peribacillus butanolivorans TaxID=421767 RepID=UPI0035E342DF
MSNNEKSTFGLLPLLPKEREWNFLDFSVVNIGLSIATYCFLIGGTLSLFVGLKLGMAATLAGSTIAVIIMALSSTQVASKYGLDQYVSLRSVFGSKGTKIPLLVIWFIEFGWVAILAIMFGKAMDTILGQVFNFKSSNITVIFFGLVALVIGWLIVSNGPKMMNKLNLILAPALVVTLISMVGLILNSYSVIEIFAFSPTDPSENAWWNYMIAFELGLAAGFSWWPIMGGLARLTKSQRTAFWPNMIGLNLCAVAGCSIGLLTGLAIGNSDPTGWMIPLGGPILGIIALTIIACGNLTCISSIIYSVTLSLKQIEGLVNVEWKKMTFIFVVPIIPLVLFPTQIYNNFFMILAACGVCLGPISAITLVDYFILRKQKLDLFNLYKSGNNPYYFWKGYNFVAIFSFVISTATYFVILNPITLESTVIFLYMTATIPVTLLAGGLYYILTKLIVIPKGLGGYAPKRELTTVKNETLLKEKF